MAVPNGEMHQHQAADRLLKLLKRNMQLWGRCNTDVLSA
jgi:hypothetical protein